MERRNSKILVDIKTKQYYKNSTDRFLKNANPNSHELQFYNSFIDNNGKLRPIIGKEIAHPILKCGDEYEKAIWLKKTFGGEIHMVPRITDISNEGFKVSTPDYIWNKESWDLKTPTDRGKWENSIERFFKNSKKARKKANKFIIDFKNFSNRTDDEIIELAMQTLNNVYRHWIEDLMLVRKDKLIIIYSRIK